MSQTTLLDNEYATLWYHPESKIVHHRYKKFIYGDNFRNVLSAGVEAFAKFGARKWLSDDRNNSALPADDVQWAQEVWAPKVMRAGWKYWAIVMPDKVVGQMTMQRSKAVFEQQGVMVEVFDDPNEALSWLESKN